MNSRAEYHTQQRHVLLDFLEKHSEHPMSVDEICRNLTSIGKSTVYRLINKMAEDGIVRRFPGNSRNMLVYQYTGKINCDKHLHLKCLNCGKLIHIEDELSEKLDGISEKYHFNIDNNKSVLYGCCDECSIKHEAED